MTFMAWPLSLWPLFATTKLSTGNILSASRRLARQIFPLESFANRIILGSTPKRFAPMTGTKKKANKPAAERPYHHGDLHAALIRAGEVVLRRDGVAGLGMRAVSREAGVSHTAAKPHFGSLDGLRAQIAAKGYDQLAEKL